jgi:hypothetical protein
VFSLARISLGALTTLVSLARGVRIRGPWPSGIPSPRTRLRLSRLLIRGCHLLTACRRSSLPATTTAFECRSSSSSGIPPPSPFVPGYHFFRRPSLHPSLENAQPIPPVPTEGGRRIRPCRTRGWMGGDGNRADEGLPGFTRNLGGTPTGRMGGAARRERWRPSILMRDSRVVGFRPSSEAGER